MRFASVITGIFIVLLFLAQAQAVEWTRVAGSDSPGVIIIGESPECWFSPSHYSVEAPASLHLRNIMYDIHGRVIAYYASGTGNGHPVESHVYGGIYNSLGQVIAFEESRAYPESASTYYISVSNVEYDSLGHVLDGYDVNVVTMENQNLGTWNGTFDTTVHPGNGTISNWTLRDDITTEGDWVLDMGDAGVISINPAGYYMYENGQLSFSCTGTATYTSDTTTSYSDYTLFVTGTIDDYPATGTYEISFTDPNWGDDNGTWEVMLTGDFCNAEFSPPDGYIDVWDLMYFADCWHCRHGDPCWDGPPKCSICDLVGPNFDPPDGYIDVWDLMVFADNWHKGQKP